MLERHAQRIIGVIQSDLHAAGFSIASSDVTRALLGAKALAGWDFFSRSWDDLRADAYMASGDRYRYRRFATFRVSPQQINRKPHQPHYQSRYHNPLYGGIHRWFEPVSEAIGRHDVTMAMLGLCRNVFGGILEGTEAATWHAEFHQFRIEAGEGVVGLPTPEGIHRDGVDWVLVVLVTRHNVAGATTTLFDDSKKSIGKFTLTSPLDAVFLNDRRVLHGVTSITPLAGGAPCFRDVVVITLSANAPHLCTSS